MWKNRVERQTLKALPEAKITPGEKRQDQWKRSEKSNERKKIIVIIATKSH